MPYPYDNRMDILRSLLLNPSANSGGYTVTGKTGKKISAAEPPGLPADDLQDDMPMDDLGPRNSADAAAPADGFYRSNDPAARKAMDDLAGSSDVGSSGTTPAKSNGYGANDNKQYFDFLNKRTSAKDANMRKSAREFLGYGEGASLADAADAARNQSWKDLQAQRRESGQAPAMGVDDALAAIEKWKRFGGPKPPPWAFTTAGVNEADVELQRQATRDANSARTAESLQRKATTRKWGSETTTTRDPATGELVTRQSYDFNKPTADMSDEDADDLMQKASKLLKKAKATAA